MQRLPHRSGVGGRRPRCAFQLAHARVEVDIQIALALLRLLELVGQHLDLAADLGDVALQPLDVVGEIDERPALQLPLELGNAVVQVLLQLVDALVCRDNALARFLVIEQRGVRELRDEGNERKRSERRVPAHRKSPEHHSPK